MRKWLSDVRSKTGKSQYTVAREVGISQSYYAAIEVGSRGKNLPVSTAKKIAEVLGFGWEKFFEDEANKTA